MVSKTVEFWFKGERYRVAYVVSCGRERPATAEVYRGGKWVQEALPDVSLFELSAPRVLTAA